MPILPVESEWLSVPLPMEVVKVDKKERVLRDYVVAQEGIFKSRRGQFNERSLTEIVDVMSKNKLGTKVRLGHPSASDDGVSKQIALARNPRMDTVTVETENGIESLRAVRADMKLLDSSFNTDGPHGNIGKWILDTAEEAPHMLSSSLVLKPRKERVLTVLGTPEVDENGNEIPPIWYPLSIHASDLVDTGDAVDGLLSVDGMPDEELRRGVELLNEKFAGQTRDVVKARCLGFLERYLNHRFGEIVEDTEDEPSGPNVAYLERMRKLKARKVS